MAQIPMYAAKVNSPETTLNGGINDTVTTITVVDASVLPPAPNTFVIRAEYISTDIDLNPETVYYPTDAVAGVFTGVTRGFQGTAKPFLTGAKVSRLLTAYDADTWKHNIEDLVASTTQYRYTSADSQLQFTSANSLFQYTSQNSLSLGTGATASFRHTSADTQLQFTSANSNFRYTSANSQLQFTSANSNLLGSAATQSFRHTSADTQLRFTSADSQLQFTSANSNFRYTSADSQIAFTSAGIVRAAIIGSNTSGATASISSGTLYLAGGNNITLSQNANSITISGAVAGGAQTAISGIGASGTTYTSGTVIFSAQTNVTLNTSVNGVSQYVRLSVADPGAGGGLSWELEGANTAGTTASNASTLFLSGGNFMTLSGNSNTIVFSMNSGSLLGTGAAASFLSTSQSSLFRHTSADSQLQFTSANSLFQYTSQNSLSLGTGATQSFRHTSADSQLQFTTANTKFASGWSLAGAQTAGTTTQNISNSLYFSGGNMITLSGNASTIVVSLNSASLLGTGAAASFRYTSADTNIIKGWSLLGNTAGTTTQSTLGSLFLAGGNNITLSGNASTITIIGGAGAGGLAGAGVSNTTYTSGTVIWSAQANVTLNSSVDGASQYVRVQCPAPGGGATAKIFRPPNAQAIVPNAILQGTVYVNPIDIPYYMTATNLDVLLYISNSSSAGGTVSVNIGLYTYGGSTANSVSSTQWTLPYNSTMGNSSSYTNVSGWRYYSCSLGNWAITPGDYLLAVGFSVATGLTSGSYTYYGMSSLSLMGAEYIGAGNENRAWALPAVFSAATNVVRASFHITDLNRTGYTAQRQPHVIFKGTF